MLDLAVERFYVEVRDLGSGDVLRSWGPYNESRAETLRADKAHEYLGREVVVEERAGRSHLAAAPPGRT